MNAEKQSNGTGTSTKNQSPSLPAKAKATWPLLLLLLLPLVTRAETAVQVWVQRYNGPGNGWDQANAVAVDGSNNVIVTGESGGGASSTDYVTIKYSSAGVPLWTNRYNGPANLYDDATAIAVDASNNVIVAGYSVGSGSDVDYATIKYSSAGVPLWTNRYNGPANTRDEAYAVAVDGSNNVIVTGSSYGGASQHDYATIKYSSAGMPLWTSRYNGPANSSDAASALAVDGSNNVIVTGYSVSSGGGYVYATIKYSSAGVPVWTNRYSGPGNYDNLAWAVAVDGSNNVIVTGSSTNSASGYDYATIKYSSAGVPLWTNRYNGPANDGDFAMAVAIDGSNNVVVTGYSTGGGSWRDYATIKYSGAGVPLWTNCYNGPAGMDDYAYVVAVDGGNNVIVTGAAASLEEGYYRYDYVTIKYSSAGVPLWTNRYIGPGNGDDIAKAMALDYSNNVIVTGYSWNGTNDDYVTIKYLPTPAPPTVSIGWSNGLPQLAITGDVGTTCAVEHAGSLELNNNWQSIATNALTTSPQPFTDTTAVGVSRRFYRARLVP